VAKISYTFEPIFKSQNVMIQCKVKNLKGFFASAYTSLILNKKSTSNSKVELQKVNLTNVKTEEASLAQAH
jgi:hypothetical protein